MTGAPIAAFESVAGDLCALLTLDDLDVLLIMHGGAAYLHFDAPGLHFAPLRVPMGFA